MSLEPFKIEVSEEILEDMYERLSRARWPDQVEGADWNYGTNLDYMKQLIDYWQKEYNWRSQEEELNQFSHYHTEIDGIKIYFIHERGKG